MHLIPFIVGNIAFLLNAASFWMRDVVRLRIVAIASSVCFVIYSTTVEGGPLWLMIGWSFVFMGINLFRLGAGRSRRRRRGSDLDFSRVR